MTPSKLHRIVADDHEELEKYVLELATNGHVEVNFLMIPDTCETLVCSAVASHAMVAIGTRAASVSWLCYSCYKVALRRASLIKYSKKAVA